MVITKSDAGRTLGCQRCGAYEASMRFQQEDLVLLWFKDYDVIEVRARQFKKKFCKECMMKFAMLINEFENEIYGPPGLKRTQEATDTYDKLKKELLKDTAEPDSNSNSNVLNKTKTKRKN